MVTVPRVERHLADDTASWLQREWTLAGAYDSARATLFADATEHAAAGDGALFTTVVTAADRDEAGRLARIAAAIGHRRGWSADVRRTLLAARSALSAEVSDLRAHAAHPNVAFAGSFYATTLWSPRTQALVETADGLVTATARRHRVRTSPPPQVRLGGAAAPLAQLDRLTPQPLPMRLALAHDSNLDVWNLQDGSVRRNVADLSVDTSFTIRRVGTSLLVLSPGGTWALVPIDGGRATRLPTAADYLPAGDDGLWQVDGPLVRRLDASGHRLGRTYAMPAGFGAPFGSTADALVVGRDQPSAGTFPFVWTPATGSLRAVPGACNAGLSVAGSHLVYVPCERVQRLAVLDTGTGKVRTLSTPPGMQVLEDTEVLSPDGRRVVASLAPDGTYADSPASKVAVWYLDTGRVQVLQQPVRPLAWSADGSVLLVDRNVDFSAGTSDLPLAYWRAGTTSLVPIRIPLSDASGTAVLLGPS